MTSDRRSQLPCSHSVESKITGVHVCNYTQYIHRLHCAMSRFFREAKEKQEQKKKKTKKV